MVEIRGLNAFYGDSHILHGIDLTVATGARVALLGRNGAGKSTFLKSLTNAGPTTTGEIFWNGENLGSASSFERARLGMTFVPEDRRILSELTVFENLKMAWSGLPATRRKNTPEEILAQFPMLVPIRDRAGGLLSGGQQQILALARAAVANPTLMLLDEPTEGLAPVIVEQLVRDVLQICERSRCSMLLCEQSIWFSRRCTDFVHLIDSGRIVFSGTWEQFDQADDQRNRHLGVS